MSNHDPILGRGQLVVRACSPVHIGTNDSLTKMLTLYDAENRTLVIASSQRLIALANQTEQHREIFLRYCENANPSLRKLLDDWSSDANEVALRRIRCENAPADVRPFMRTHEGQGAAYVPGSSLKGAVRGAFLRDHYSSGSNRQWLRDNLAALDRANSNDRKRMQREIETRVFGSRPANASGSVANYDLFRYIQFADSDLLKDDALAIISTRVYSSQSNRTLMAKTRATFVEVVTPGAETRVSVTFLRMLAGHRPAKGELRHIATHATSVEAFLAACNRVSLNLIEQDLAFYRYHDGALPKEQCAWLETMRDEIKAMTDSEGALRMGAGTGFDTKSILDIADDQVFESLAYRDGYTSRLGRPSNGGPWLGAERAPKTRRLAALAGKTYPMGWVRLHWQSDGDAQQI